jgi:hypothetical protein
MSFSTQGQAVLSQDRKLVVILAVLGLATLIIADNFRRYGGAPLDPGPFLPPERQTAASRPEDVRRQLDDNAWVHDHRLAELQAAVGPHVEPRCSGSIRTQLRTALTDYVNARVTATWLATTEPALAQIAKAWRTPDDDDALKDAKSLIAHGFLLPSDFSQWPEASEAIMAMPTNVRSQCSDTIADALAAERSLAAALRDREASEAAEHSVGVRRMLRANP